ncbi:DoxX family protein [Glaciecola sp. MH2013]|uniref:DoxX family protein n=1 Tax=Glaciecola sp. MH2013 TaxID=2785524 RepID=UPI0018A00633|nr:DoxX family protein [Glaciecola sp. MH2013]MBF7072123.1 DoxX family protein [Glaciecola sp. MH2013]
MRKLINLYNTVFEKLDYLQPVGLLLARFYVAWVFFKAGLTKLRDWDSTLMLFEYEYAVPLLNFEVAAYLATFGEIVLPVLLVLGLFGRKAAIGLFIVNYVAVISFEDMPAAALNEHVYWGILMLLVAIWGAGKLSVDNLLNIK